MNQPTMTQHCIAYRCFGRDFVSPQEAEDYGFGEMMRPKSEVRLAWVFQVSPGAFPVKLYQIELIV